MADKSVTLTELKGDNFKVHYIDTTTWNSAVDDILDTAPIKISDFENHSLKLGGEFDDTVVYYMTASDTDQFDDGYWPDLITLGTIGSISTQPQLFTAITFKADVYVKFYIKSTKIKNRTGLRIYFTQTRKTYKMIQ